MPEKARRYRLVSKSFEAALSFKPANEVLRKLLVVRIPHPIGLRIGVVSVDYLLWRVAVCNLSLPRLEAIAFELERGDRLDGHLAQLLERLRELSLPESCKIALLLFAV